MKQITLLCILFLISGTCIVCQNCRNKVDSSGGSQGTDVHQPLPPGRFLALDTFEVSSGQTELSEGWDRCTGNTDWISLQDGKNSGRGLMIDGRKGVISLCRHFASQTGVFTVEMDVSMLSAPQGLIRISIAGDVWFEEYDRFPASLMRDNRGVTTSGSFMFYNKGWQDTKITPELSRWYHLKFVVDVPNQCYDMWIDGALAGSKCAFRYPGKEMHCLSVLAQGREEPGGFAPGDALVIDNVAIYPTKVRPDEGSPVEPVKIPKVESGNTAAAPAGKPGYKLTFQDEFNGSALNMNLWNIGRWRSAIVHDSLVQEFYPHEIKDGILKLRIEKRRNKEITIKDSNTTEMVENYTAPAIASFDKFEQEYGWWEIRCKMPKALGIWEGFWLMPLKGKPGAAEIDIFESLSRFNDRIFFNVHYSWDTPYKNYRKMGVWVPGLADDFHIYALKWEPEKIAMYVDGIMVYEYNGKDVPVGPLYIIVSCRTGGWAGGYLDEGALPDNFEVDYVRVYQKE